MDKSNLHQLKIFFYGYKILLMQKLCIFHAPVVKIIFDWALTISGRVLVRLRGGVKINRLCKKKRDLKHLKTNPSWQRKWNAVTKLLWAQIRFIFDKGFDLKYITLSILLNQCIAFQKYTNTKQRIKYPLLKRKEYAS